MFIKYLNQQENFINFINKILIFNYFLDLQSKLIVLIMFFHYYCFYYDLKKLNFYFNLCFHTIVFINHFETIPEFNL